MPELPEVETVCRGIRDSLINNKFTEILIRKNKLRYNIPSNLCDLIVNQQIVDIGRRAKYIIIKLVNNYNLIIHLGMSGRFTIEDCDYELQKHDHLIFKTADKFYVYNDIRRFGLIDLIRDEELSTHKYFINLAPEPFSEEFNFNYLKAKLKRKNIPIKVAIMDNNIAVGVGNIYASESLFLSKINPLRPAKDLNDSEIKLLINNILITLQKAIDAGGSSLKDYKKSDGTLGYFQHQFAVYNQDGKNCKQCDELIIKIKQAGRSSFYCPQCQQ